MTDLNKESVRIGADMLYGALITADSSSALTYGTPFALKGLQGITVTFDSTNETHYSDDGPSEVIGRQGDTKLTFDIDGLDAETRSIILGTTYGSATGQYREGHGEIAPYMAIGYRYQKGNGKYHYTWFYKGRVAKSNESGKSKGPSITKQTASHEYTAIKPIYYAGQAYGLKNSFDSDDENCPAGLTDALLVVPETGFFSSPLYVPAAPGTAIADLAGVSGDEAGEIDLTFTAPASCTSAYVQVKDPIASEWITATTYAAIVAASTSATIIGLTPGNTYDVRMVVIGGTKSGISNTDEDVVAFAGA